METARNSQSLLNLWHSLLSCLALHQPSLAMNLRAVQNSRPYLATDLFVVPGYLE
jgi:hypothetical protein